MFEAVLWFSLVAIATTYALYPLMLVLIPGRRREVVDASHTPRVSLFVSAYNEGPVIEGKLDNVLALNYPAEYLQTLVISDGSTDETDVIVRKYADRGVVLRRQEPRGGKSLGLTRFVPQASGAILVFSDANSMYEPNALRYLVRHFADEQIGYVVGHQRYVATNAEAAKSESLYWRYETFLKQHESRVGSVVGGDGAIMAIRAELFEPLRADDISDLYLPLRIVAKGYRGVFESSAVCYEQAAGDISGEFRRKVRIVTRSLLAVVRAGSVLNPLHCGVFALQLWLHKVLRWFVPFFLLVALVSSGVLAQQGRPLYQTLFGLQSVCYVFAMLRLMPMAARFRSVSVVFYFCMMNAAAFLGVLNCVIGRRISTWQPERMPVEDSTASAKS